MYGGIFKNFNIIKNCKKYFLYPGEINLLKRCSTTLIRVLLSRLLQVYSASLCGVCPPGTFVSSQCSQTSSRLCEPCRSGTYMDRPTLSDKCLRCKECTGKRLVHKACNKTHDTVCKCKLGQFFNSDLLVCFPCTPCEIGEGVVKNCSDTSDTVCEACKVGIRS